ncbi:MAG: hypothetical protein ACRDT6_18945 [Micromonosporaceae bacterium]
MGIDDRWDSGTDPAYEGADPAYEAVAERLLSDPRALSERLTVDLAAVAALGRDGVRVPPGQTGETLVESVRSQADQLGFGSPVQAATASAAQVAQLPWPERTGAPAIEAYHRSASLTVAGGDLVLERAALEPGRELVFRRRAVDANSTGVQLEAVVRAGVDGVVTLESYGWPTEAPAYVFDGPVSGYVSQLLEDLGQLDAVAEALHPALFRQAMLMAYGVVASRVPGAAGDAVESAAPGVLEAVVPRAELLAEYLEAAYDLVERGGRDGWIEACVRRSAAEALFSRFLGSAAFELVDATALAELTQEVAAGGAALPVAQRRALTPIGTPGSHTWWHS